MKKTTKALIWATVIIALAVASAYGFVGRDAAQTLLIVLPLIAWLSITDSVGCGPCGTGQREERA